MNTPQDNQSKGLNKITGRWLNAFRYSMQGLRAALKYEKAVREEFIMLAVAIPLAFLISDSALYRLLMIASVILVIIVELLNSAIEATLDRISDEYHELTKRGKDYGSLSVLLSIMIALMVWVGALF